MHGLQGQRQNHHVKAVIAKPRQTRLQILLQHVQAFGHAGRDIGVIFLNAVAGYAALTYQFTQQRAVAAAQIEHMHALGNPAADDFKIRALRAREHRRRIERLHRRYRGLRHCLLHGLSHLKRPPH